MKKIVALILVIATFAALLTSCKWFGKDPDKEENKSRMEFELLYDGTYGLKSAPKDIAGEVAIPATYEGKAVTEILPSAFERCALITSVTVPDSVSRIGEGAFRGCVSLEKITLSDSVSHIEKEAFLNTAFYDNKSNWTGGVLYIGNHLIKGDGISGELAVKSGTRTIANDALYSQMDITGITIPEGVVTIGTNAFYDCRNAEGGDLPSTLRYIGASAFSGCYKISQSGIPDGVEYIGGNAFSPSSYTYNNSNYDSDGILYIGKHLIEAKGKASGNYTIKAGTITIAGGALSNCQNLLAVSIPESVRTIGDYAFQSSDKLEAVNIPGSVKHIGELAFYRCTGLTSLNIPSSVEYIGRVAFAYTSENLESITVDKNNPNYYSEGNCLVERHTGKLILGCNTSVIPKGVMVIGDMAFYNCKLMTELNIPEGVEEIVTNAFSGCTRISKITLPDSMRSIGSYVFNGTAYYENKDNWTDGALYIGKHLVSTNRDEISSEYSVKDGTLTIADNAFTSCTYLTGVDIPASVREIGFGAFSFCSSLVRVEIPEGVREIKDYTFDNCKALETMEIPENIESVGNCAFRGCKKLADVTISGSVKWLGDEVFSGCEALEEIVLPESVTHIGDRAFVGCYKLAGVTIPKNVTVIGEYTFSHCYALKEVNLPEGLQSIGAGAFGQCYELCELVVPGSVKNIDSEAFRYSKLVRVLFAGSEVDYGAAKRGDGSFDPEGMEVYFYSEKAPAGAGKFWHYDESGKPDLW